jgi:hypothetical protein
MQCGRLVDTATESIVHLTAEKLLPIQLCCAVSEYLQQTKKVSEIFLLLPTSLCEA